MNTKWTVAGLGLGLALLGCASGGGSAASGAPSAGGGAAQNQAPRVPNLITAEELANEAGGNAYDAIDHLRHTMLTARPTGAGGAGGGGGGRSRGGGGGGASSTGPNVYLDGKRLGDTSTLRNVAVNTLKEIRFYNASDANERFGPGNPAGVIALTSK